MRHLVQNDQDIENNVFKGDPDDFILPEDELVVEEPHDRHEQQRIDDKAIEDLRKALRKEIKRIARIAFCQKQAN